MLKLTEYWHSVLFCLFTIISFSVYLNFCQKIIQSQSQLHDIIQSQCLSENNTNHNNGSGNCSKENTSTSAIFLSLNIFVGVYVHSEDFLTSK